MDAARIYKNCMVKEESWKHLGKLKLDLLRSGYPENIINSHILEGIKDKNGKEKKEKQKFDYYLQIPYLNEAFTRMVKKAIEKSNLKIRVVCKSGKTLKSVLKPHHSKLCNLENCQLCKNNIPCKMKHFIYEFTCNHCTKNVTDNITKKKNNKYIGASRRIALKRLGEHEQSVRRFNNRTTLGQHMMENTTI